MRIYTSTALIAILLAGVPAYCQLAGTRDLTKLKPAVTKKTAKLGARGCKEVKSGAIADGWGHSEAAEALRLELLSP